jgi:uncharacterized integral membrane protein
MTTPIDPPPQQPVPNQPGAGRLDQPAGHEYRRPITDPVPGPNVSETATPQTAAARNEPPAPGFDERGRVSRGRVSRAWVGLIGTAIFLILLIIFIAQNSHPVSVHFLGWSGRFSLALTILASAIAGLLLVAIPGSLRILQLRRALRLNGPARR